MGEMRRAALEGVISIWRAGLAVFCWLIFAGVVSEARETLQFDVFFGFEQTVREGCWFPVTCEIENDGPTFTGTIEVKPSGLSSDQVRRISVELPTNTRKRVSFILFEGDRNLQWTARLLDERGKVRIEQPGIQPRSVMWEGTMLGALPRSFSSAPVYPALNMMRRELTPQVPRIPVEQFPDNPLGLEALAAVYLNSERALDLKPNQANALLTWLNEGGHLILAVEQLADINSTPWLKRLFPYEVDDFTNITPGAALEDWAKQQRPSPAMPVPMMGGRRASLPAITADGAFGSAVMPVITGKTQGGKVVLEGAGHPLMVEAPIGRGRVTALLFNPEKEPFRSWKNRGWFWTKLTRTPLDKYLATDFYPYGGSTVDSVIAALLETDQVQKLPVQWLLGLLVLYLLIIGPFDYFWLKKINRQMLTWITFPGYVFGFSLLIYLIGYKLRAGVNEWNELDVVDVFPRGERAEFRGYAFASLYSSANNNFPVAREPSYAGLRGDMIEVPMMSKAGQTQVEQRGNGFRAEVYVPVWTSVLLSSDWLEQGAPPIKASVVQEGSDWVVNVENGLNRSLEQCRLVVNGNIYTLGNLGPRENKTIRMGPEKAVRLVNYLQQHAARFSMAASQRQNPLGRDQASRLKDPADTAITISFTSQLQGMQPNQRGFVWPPCFDLSPVVEAGGAVLLAFDPGHSFGQPLPQFTPPRAHRNTLLRLSVPVR